jgi:flagellar hook protein FlgE
MIEAMNSAISGLDSFNTDMDVIGNNIANLNTVSYKSSSANFEDLLSQTIQGATSTTDPMQVGMGTALSSIAVNETQGSLQSTGVTTDCAIQGDGYFIVSNGSSKSYTRDGSFQLDSAGDLVSSSGMSVLGWEADSNGNIDTSASIGSASTIQIPVGTLTACKATTSTVYNGMLDTNTAEADPYTVSTQVYDSEGTAHTLDVTFTQQTGAVSQGYSDETSNIGTGTVAISVGGGTATDLTVDSSNDTLQGLANTINGTSGLGVTATIVNQGTTASPSYALELSSTSGAVTMDTTGLTAGSGTVPSMSTLDEGWTWSASSPDAVSGASLGSGTLTFDTSGKCTSNALSVTLPLANPDGASGTMDVSVNVSGITLADSTSTVSTASQNGYASGTLSSYTIGSGGVITGTFSNGMSRALGQIALATFSNPQGLQSAGDNTYTDSINSGLAQVGTANVGGMGSISSGYLESSNVDLSTQFTNMIVAQRSFQANTKTITTSDQMLQDLLQLRS